MGLGFGLGVREKGQKVPVRQKPGWSRSTATPSALSSSESSTWQGWGLELGLEGLLSSIGEGASRLGQGQASRTLSREAARARTHNTEKEIVKRSRGAAWCGEGQRGAERGREGWGGAGERRARDEERHRERSQRGKGRTAAMLHAARDMWCP